MRLLRAGRGNARPLNCGVRRMPRAKRISYSRQQITQVLRSLNELVVSLDRIGSVSQRWSSTRRDKELAKFVKRHAVFRKLAKARTVLSAPFSTELGPDGMDELERAMQSVRYWKPSITKRRKTVR
jgi:hypothetical protein